MRKLINLGVDDSLKSYQLTMVKNANIMAIVFTTFAVCFLLFLFFYQPEEILFSLILFIPPLTVWLFNFVNLSFLSRPLFLVSGLLIITLLHGYFVLPGQSVLFYFLIAQLNFFVVFWTLIDTRERFILLPTLAAMLLIFFSFPWINERFDSERGVPELTDSTVKIIGYIINLLTTFTALYSIQKRSQISEEGIEELKLQLEEKSNDLAKKEKELHETLQEISRSHNEEDKRNWVASGLTKINNILRGNDSDIFKKVLLGIVEHGNLLYGGIYEIEAGQYGENFLILKASYGYARERLQNNKLPIDDGLLSRAYHEHDIVHLTEIPSNYSKIASGLGEAHPGTLVILPLIYEEHIEGILEVAAFRRLEDHEIEYFKKVSVILGRFIESYKSDAKTKELLEKTQQQTEEMRAQEEEMRQNMEELQATQEELHRKEQEYINKIKDLKERVQK